MYYAQLIIPKISDKYKLYVYCSKNAESINTIEKVKTFMPTFIIDEAVAKTHKINNRDCYVVYDINGYSAAGVTHNGPSVNIVPTSEYERSIGMVKLNNFTYLNEVMLDDLPLKYNGTMLYYSVIGVDEENSMITHLSDVNGVMIRMDYKKNGSRHLYSSEDGETWKYVAGVNWDEPIMIGNINDKAEMDRFGIPFVETVPIFSKEDVNVSLRPLSSQNFVVLEIPNPWQKNNETYNFRRMKSYKLQNVVGEQYSEFSEPTYQSLLPVSMEKMVILRTDDSGKLSADGHITIETVGVDKWEVIRKDGIFYNRKEHKQYGMNKYNIPVEEKTAIFSEGSVQDLIKIQAESLPVKTYYYTIYLIDVYGKMSEPCSFAVNT